MSQLIVTASAHILNDARLLFKKGLKLGLRQLGFVEFLVCCRCTKYSEYSNTGVLYRSAHFFF